ncbi:MAG: DUF2628 domain-containing protein [Parvibaculum sp.]
MRTFSVYHNPDLPDAVDQIRFVKEGMAVWALVAPLLWFLYHRLWWEAAILFGISIIMALAADQWGIPEITLLVANSLLQVLIACEANDLRAYALRRKGFRQIAVTHGVDEAEAEIRFFANWVEKSASTAAMSASVSSSVFDRAGERDLPKSTKSTKPIWPKQAEPAPQAKPDDVLGLFPAPPPKLG